jgi:hypothetical protein
LKTHLIFSVVALAVATCCAKDPKAVIESDDTEKFLREKAAYESNIGKDYWVNLVVLLCPTPTVGNRSTCATLVKPIKLHLDGIEKGEFGRPYFHATLTDGRSGYFPASDLQLTLTGVDLEKAAAECKRRGNPRVGMSAKQVVATCWGKPDHVDHRETPRGVSERYVYDGGRHVLFHNGIVTSVQTSGELR